MPGNGKHSVNTIDSFFKERPSFSNVREGETVSFLEKGNLVKLEKRNGVIYQSSYKEVVSTSSLDTSSEESDITSVLAGTGLSGGGSSGDVTLSINSTVTTLTGSQTLTNKTLTSPVINTGVSGTAILDENDMSSDSDTKLATQQSIKAYVDSEISGIAAPANATITLSPGAGLAAIGDFTTNQSSNETLTIAVDGVLEDLDTLGAASSNGQFIVATGSGAFQYESGSTARTSLGLGTLATLSSISDSQVASDAQIQISKLEESAVTITAGAGLTDGGSVALGSSTTLNIGAGTGITVNANDVALTNTSVSYGGVSVALGASDATPAFDLQDATGLPIIGGTTGTLSIARGGTGGTTTTAARSNLGLGNLAVLDTISDSQVASDASIAITKLAESSITVADGSSSTAISLGNTITFSGTSNEVTVGESSGTITVGLPDDVVIANSLVVNGTTTTIDTTNLIVEDPLIKLAKANNAADSVDIGFYGLYDTSGTDKYAGLFRDANDSGKFKLFKDLQVEPTTTVDVTETGYAKATLVADLEGNVTGNATGNAGTATKLANARDISLTGDITGVTPGAGFDGSAAVNIATTIADDSVALGTKTTGNYVATLTAGNLIDLQNNSGEGATPTIDVDLSELNTSTSDGDGDFFAVVDSSNAQKKLTKGNINISGFNNDSGFTSNAGTVTSVTVTGGNGLTGGGSAITGSGTVTLAVGSDSLAISSNKVDIAFSALSTISDSIATDDNIIFFDSSNNNEVQINAVSDLPFTNNAGTITSVTGGSGLSGSASSGGVTLAVGAGTGISVATNSISTNDSEIVHDNLSGFVANEHKDHSSIDIASGAGLTGGGDITATRTLAVGAGDGIAVNANDVEVDFSGLALLNTDSEPLTSQDTVVVYNQSADAIVQLSVDDIGGGAVSAVANGANNRIATFSSSDALNGEANLTFDGTNLRLPGDNLPMTFGAGNDLKIHHSGSNSFIAQTTGATGHLYIDNNVDDKDIIFRTDDGSGGVTPYLTLDGSATQTLFHQNTRLQADQKSLSVGADNDLRMIHDTHSYLQNTTATMMVIQNTGQDQDIAFMANDNGSNNHVMRIQGATGRVGIGVTAPEDLLHIHSTGDTNLRIKSTANKSQIRFQNDTQSWFTGITSDESYFWYGTEIAGTVGFIQSSGGNLYWNYHFLNNNNGYGLVGRATDGNTRNTIKIDSSNNVLVGDSNLAGNTYTYSASRMYINTDAGQCQIGPQNTSWNHIYTDRQGHLFDSNLTALDGKFQSYSGVDLNLRRSQGDTDRLLIQSGVSTFSNQLHVEKGLSVDPKTHHENGDGRFHLNVLQHRDNANRTGAIIIDTDIARTSNRMSVIHVHGYGYGQNTVIDFKVCFYPYSGSNGPDGNSGSVIAYSLTDDGSDGKPKFLGINSSGNVAIAIDDYNGAGKYFYNFQVDFYNGTSPVQLPTWDVSYSTTDGFGWIQKHTLKAPIKQIRTANNVYTSTINGKLGVGVDSPQEEVDITGSLKVRGDGHAATDVLELGQLTDNATTPMYMLSTFDNSGGHLSIGDHLQFKSQRYGQNISFARNGAGGPVPTALFYNASDTGYMDLYRALNPTADATYQSNVRLHVNGNSFLRGGPLTIGDTAPLTTGGTPRLSLRGAGLNIGSGTNDMSYIRRIDTGDYQWQTWNGSNDGEIHLQPYGGKLGVGTTSPQRKLHVSTGNTDIAARFENTTSNGSVAEFISSGDSRTLTIQTDHIYSNGSLFFGLGNYTNTYRGADHRFQVGTGNTEEFRVDTSGTLTTGQTRTTNEYQVNSNGTTIRRYVSTWNSGMQTHDVLYNGYGNTMGDYAYLKTSGNTSTTHGMLLSSDNYLFWGRANLLTGAVANSATAPFEDVCMRVDSSGNGLFDGDVVAFSTTIASDARLKENVKDLNYGLKDVLDIRPVSFDWKEKRNGQHDIGVIAQEIEKIIPEVVVEVDTLNSEDTHKTVDYAKLTSVLIKAVQEQQQQINELKEKLNG